MLVAMIMTIKLSGFVTQLTSIYQITDWINDKKTNELTILARF